LVRNVPTFAEISPPSAIQLTIRAVDSDTTQLRVNPPASSEEREASAERVGVPSVKKDMHFVDV